MYIFECIKMENKSRHKMLSNNIRVHAHLRAKYVSLPILHS